jgi:hypothetical protein
MVTFSKFDLCNGYWNVRNSEETEDLMAFKMTRGLYAPRVMSFGPTNAPACMQRFMNHVFQPLRDRYPGHFENYMDDCAIVTREGELELHRQITREFFEILCENHLFLRPQKCLVEAEEMDFLGMRLNHHSITIDPAKVKGLTDWPRELRNVKEIRKVLGVLGYQRPFIPNFACFAQPLTHLLKKDTPFEWTSECRASLETLISIVTSSPVLIAPDQERQFELEVDASQFAIGAILWQRDPAKPKKLRACGYYSATLSLAKWNYKVFDRELLGIIRALCHWSHLLHGTVLPVLIWTDHRNLTYWIEPHKVSPHATTWQVELTQYNYELRHKPGDTMKANALSHRPDFDTENPENEHLIVLPLDRFKGMPESVAQTLGTQSNSTSEITLAVAGLEDGTLEEENLDARVKLYQNEHYQSLLS